MTLLARVVETRYPRLSLLVAGGIGLVLLGNALIAVDPHVASSTDLTGARMAVVGVLLIVFGGAGVLALRVFETAPDGSPQ